MRRSLTHPVIELDARLMEPPEPMQRALEAIEQLAPGSRLRMLHHREPYPLYTILDKRHFFHRTTALADGSFEILIWR
ncbi:MAG TPA: DUF2249 domain-containing protein [Gallionellaceae bacterium]|nr:DUF2249 domain-containing protein [Gallionellaceae bacterium]